MKKIYFTTEICELGSVIMVSTMRDILDGESSFEKKLQKILGGYNVCETTENIYEITDDDFEYLTEDELLEVEDILLGLGWEKGEWDKEEELDDTIYEDDVEHIDFSDMEQKIVEIVESKYKGTLTRRRLCDGRLVERMVYEIPLETPITITGDTYTKIQVERDWVTLWGTTSYGSYYYTFMSGNSNEIKKMMYDEIMKVIE